jgi:hypothetical protein
VSPTKWVILAGVDSENLADVAQRGPGAHRVVVDDAGNLVGTPPPNEIVDDFLSAGGHEVEVGVGEIEAVGVDEPLEQEIEPDGVNVCDAHQVSDQAAAHGTSAGADIDAVLLRPLHEILHEQEVLREALALQRVQLELEAGQIGAGELRDGRLVREDRLAEPLAPALLAFLHELGVWIRGERGEVRVLLRPFVAAAELDELVRVGQPVAELGLHVLIVALLDRAACGDATERELVGGQRDVAGRRPEIVRVGAPLRDRGDHRIA